MSSNNNFNKSPNHFMVLDAISRGMKKIDSIAKVTKLSKDEVELIVNDLRNQKLINAVVKKGFFGNKKTEFHISETGMKLLDSKKQELSHTSQRLQQLYETGNRGQMQSMMDDNRSWMPMMLFSGIMSMVMFGSMMGFMGMAMNPAESAQTEGQVDDSGAASDTGASDTGASDTGASDTGDTGGFSDMGADSGMDTGGFDSF
jgi:hypothetical protein